MTTYGIVSPGPLRLLHPSSSCTLGLLTADTLAVVAPEQCGEMSGEGPKHGLVRMVPVFGVVDRRSTSM